MRRFGADPGIIGTTIDLGGTKPVVVGVLPASFENVLDPTSQIFRALGYRSQEWACRSCRHLRMVGRVRDGTTHAAAQRELTGLMERMSASFPDTYPGAGAVVERLNDRAKGTARARPQAAVAPMRGAPRNPCRLTVARIPRTSTGTEARKGSLVGAVGFQIGLDYIIDAFLVVVVGGIGQLKGTVIVAFALFLLVKGFNTLRRKQDVAPEAPEAPVTPPRQELLLEEIRDLLAKPH